MKKESAPLSLREAFTRFFSRYDHFLIAGAVIGFLLMIFLMPGLPHVKELNTRISDTEAESLAAEYVEGLGYDLEQYRTTIVHRKRKDDLNSLRVDFTENELKNGFQNNPRLEIPLYHISVIFYPLDASSVTLSQFWNRLLSGDEIDNNDFSSFDRHPALRVNLSLAGEIFEFRATGQPRITSGSINRKALEIGAGVVLPDTIRIDQLGFELPDGSVTGYDVTENDDGFLIRVDQDIISGLAGFYLNGTRWADTPVTFDSTGLNLDNESYTGTAIFNSESSIFNRTLKLTVDVDAAGNLHRINPEFVAVEGITLPGPAQKQSETYGSVLISILVILALIVLIRRFGRGLVDIRSSRIDALVGAGALLVFIALNTSGKLARSEPIGSFDLLGPIFATTFATIGGWLLIFIISVYANSISQEVWPQKLKQLNLIRKGFIINQPVGMTLIRSVLYSLILGGIYIMYIRFVPHHGLIWTDDYIFYTDRTILSSLHLIGSSIFGAIFFLFNFILGINTLIYRKFKKGWVSILTIAAVWTIGGFITFDVITIWYNLPMVMIVGLIIGGLFWWHGPVTAMVSYIFFEFFLLAVNGFSINSNPDIWNMLVLVSVPLAALFVGMKGIKSNTTSEELPDYIPSYLIELANKQRMERELEIARQVQLSFLPEETPVFSGIELSAQCHPASEVGGDYYDFLPASDGKLGLVIGDVSGKGIQAAFYMTLIKGFTQSLSDEITDPGIFLSRTNSLFYRNAKRGTFISMIYGVLDISERKFRFSRAGHNPLILVRQRPGTAELVQSGGMAIGLANDKRFEDSLKGIQLDLEAGDMIVMYTDGYTEAMNYSKDLYGEERLLEIIQKNIGCTADEMLEKINNDVAAFTGGSNQTDDMTIIIVKMN